MTSSRLGLLSVARSGAVRTVSATRVVPAVDEAPWFGTRNLGISDAATRTQSAPHRIPSLTGPLAIEPFSVKSWGNTLWAVQAQIGYLLQQDRTQRLPTFPSSSTIAQHFGSKRTLHGVLSDSGLCLGSATGGRLPCSSGEESCEGSSETPLTWGGPRSRYPFI